MIQKMNTALTPFVKLVLALLSVYLVWGSTYLGMKVAMEHLPPIFTASFRYTIAGILFFCVAMLMGIGWPTREQLLSSMWVGFLLAGFGNSAVALALSHMPSGLVAVLCALVPLLMTMINWLFFDKKRPTNISILGLLIGFLGVLYLVNPFGDSTQTPFWPTLIVFGGCVAWAWGSIQSPYLNQPHPLQSTGIQLVTGGIFSLFISIGVEHHQLELLAKTDVRFWKAMLYLIFIGSGVGYTAYVWLLQHASPRLTATYAYVNPVVAIFLGWIILNEQLTFQSVVSSSIVLTGVALMIAGKRVTSKA